MINIYEIAIENEFDIFANKMKIQQELYIKLHRP